MTELEMGSYETIFMSETLEYQIIYFLLAQSGCYSIVFYIKQMFDFLTKLSHQHSPKKQNNQEQNNTVQPNNKKIESPISKIDTIQKQKTEANKLPKKHLSLSAQLQAGQTASLPPQILAILDKIKDQSETRFKPMVTNLIQEQRAGVQRKVYLRQMSNNNEQYLEEVLIQSSSENRFGLEQIVDNVASSIYEDILMTNKYKVHKRNGLNKEEVLMNSLNYLRSKDGNLRNKIGELNLQLREQAQKIEERSYDIVNKSSANNMQKNKEVQIFLKNIQNQRAQQRMRYQEELQKQKEKKKRQQYMKQIMKEKALSERHERLVEAYEIKKKIKEQEKAANKRRDEEFNEFLKTYKKRKPLYREKEEEFVENVVMKREEEIFNKLLQRKQVYAPMSFQDIQDHEDRYIDYKIAKDKVKKAQRKLLKEAQKSRMADLDELHKGKFRYYVLQDLVDKKQKQMRNIEKEKIIANKIKQKAYSMNVKQYHKPTVDPVKRLELQSLVAPSSSRSRYQNPVRMRVNSSNDGEQYYSIDEGYRLFPKEKDAKKEGERNRRFLKQYIRQKIDRGQIKKEEEQPRSSTVQQKINYLDEIRENRRSQQDRYSTIDHSIQNIKNKSDLRSLKVQAEHYDQKAKRLEQKFKHVGHKPEEQAELEADYLYSIKAKLQLLNNFD